MVQIQRLIVSLSQGCRGQIKRNHSEKRTCERIAVEHGVGSATVRRAEKYSRGIDAAEEAVPGAQEEILTGHIKTTDEQIVALASIPKEERPAILEELKKKKSDRDDTVLERLKPNRPPPKPKPAPQKKKPTATENNTASQAEQSETSVQAPITESPPEEEIEPTSNAPPSFLQILCRHGAAYRLGTGRETPCGSSAEQHWKPSFAYIDRCNCYHPDGKEEKPAHPCAGGFQPGL